MFAMTNHGDADMTSSELDELATLYGWAPVTSPTKLSGHLLRRFNGYTPPRLETLHNGWGLATYAPGAIGCGGVEALASSEVTLRLFAVGVN